MQSHSCRGIITNTAQLYSSTEAEETTITKGHPQIIMTDLKASIDSCAFYSIIFATVNQEPYQCNCKSPVLVAISNPHFDSEERVWVWVCVCVGKGMAESQECLCWGRGVGKRGWEEGLGESLAETFYFWLSIIKLKLKALYSDHFN